MEMIRTDFWPHPLTAHQRCTVVAEAGQTLEGVFAHLIPPTENAVAVVNGEMVRREAWHGVVLNESDIVQVRLTLDGINPIAAVLLIALVIAAPFAAPIIAGAIGVTSAAGIAAITGGIVVAGTLAINALFPVRLPKVDGGQPDRLYSLNEGSNLNRPYDPLLLVLGLHRMFPDLTSKPYTEFGSESDQYLNQIFDFGLGELSLTEVRLGDTLLSSFDEIQTQIDVDRVTLLHGNVDRINGSELEYNVWVERTTAVDTVAIAFDLVTVNFRTTKGKVTARTSEFRLEWRVVGSSGVWTGRSVSQIADSLRGQNARKPARRSFKYNVQKGKYDVRVKVTKYYPLESTDDHIQEELAAIRAFQEDLADFTGRHPFALRIKATGQLYGSIDNLNAMVGQKIDGVVTSNPADILLWWYRGYRINGRLAAGYGLPDNLIDMDALDGFRTHCDLHGLECNIILQDGRDDDAVARLIAQCGWARIDISTGKHGVLWEDSGRPMTAIINPDNIVADSLVIVYENENLADEIVGTFFDADSDFKKNTIRRPVPNLTITGEFPVTIPLEGITNGEQAAKEVNRMAAAQTYHQRTISWEMDEEGFVGVGVGDVVGMASGLVGEGQGGRLLSIEPDRLQAVASFEVGHASGTAWLWDMVGNVSSTSFSRSGVSDLEFSAAIPQPPAGMEDNPAVYRIMLFGDEDAAPKAVRVIGFESVGDGRYKFSARDEVDAYYEARVSNLGYDLIPITVTQRPPPSGLVITVQGGTRWIDWSPYEYPVLGYELRFGPLDTDFDDMESLSDGLIEAGPVEFVNNPPAGEWRFGLVAVGRDGRASEPTYNIGTLPESVDSQAWFNGSGPPAEEIGINGNYYLDNDSGQVFEHKDDEWVRKYYGPGQINSSFELILGGSSDAVLPENDYPDNDWGFAVIGQAGNVQWSNGGLLAPSEELPYTWQSRRETLNVQIAGSEVLADWSVPEIYIYWAPGGAGFEDIYWKGLTYGLGMDDFPSNTWGYGVGGTAFSGAIWTYGSQPALAPPYLRLWRCSRAIVGSPNNGDAVDALWSFPTHVAHL